MKLYALHDYNLEKKKQGAFVISKEQAYSLNKDGYGIHFTPNIVNGSRKEDNVIEIRYWFADFDVGEKKEQMRKINKLLLRPSTIIESKRGYHVYWKAKKAEKDNFKIICKGIAKKLGSDEATITANRLFRLPGFYHMKDKNNPFLVKMIFKSQETYTEKEMLYAFAYKEPVKQRKNHAYNQNNNNEMLNPENWEKIFFLSRIVSGCRNNEFARITLWLRDEGFSAHEIKESVYEMNRRIIEPLPDREIESILRGKI